MERPQAITDPLTRTTTTIYDADGIATTVAAPMNRVTTTTYVLQPGQPRLVTTTNPLTHATISQYDATGQQRFLNNHNSQVFEMTYDALGRLAQTIQPGGRAHGIAYAWNSAGLRQTITEPSTQTAILQHDARGRLVSKTVPDATTSYGYDASGNLLTVTEGAAVLTRTYEADRDLVNSYTNAAGEVIGYAHDANGNLTTLTYPGGRQVHYAYDKRDQLVSVTDWEQRRTTFQYDLSGRLISVRRPNGTTRLLAYDAAGQMLALREVGPGGALIATQGWRYDEGGRPTARVRQPQPAAFSSPAFSATYHDDNRLNTLTPNGGSAVTVISDPDGNLLSTPLWEPTQTWQSASFTWDARNRLLSAATANGSAAYTYDAEGHLIERTANAQPTRYTVNPNATLSQVLIAHHSDTSKTFYVYGATGLLYEETFDATNTSQGTRSYHADQVGSTIALTDDAGQVTGRLEYTTYGLTSHTSGNVDTPFRYNGAYGVMTDPDTGLLHMRARWYSPSLGRFLSEDPIEFSGGLNWYAYADGDPVGHIDPNGEFANFVFGAAFNVVVGAAVRGLTGGSIFDGKAMLGDAAIGAATSGLGAWAQLRHANKLAQSGKIIAKLDDAGRIAGQTSSHTFGHNTRMISEAVHHVRKGATVYLDKSLGRAISRPATNSVTRMRPDVTAVYGGGRTHVTEIVSASQKYAELSHKVGVMRGVSGGTGNVVGTNSAFGTTWVNPFTYSTGLGTSASLGGAATTYKNYK